MFLCQLLLIILFPFFAWQMIDDALRTLILTCSVRYSWWLLWRSLEEYSKCIRMVSVFTWL